MMDIEKAIILDSGEGKSFWVLGDLYTFKATGRETNDAFTIIDQVVQPQSGPPPHIHKKEDETFYVQDGKFSFLCGDKQREVESGSFVYVPKETLHTFKNITDRPGRLLVFITPAGLEDFFYKIGTPATDTTTPPPFDPAVLDKVMQLAGSYNMEIKFPT